MINYDNVRAALKSTNGKIFTVTFIKRSTGEKRVMNARLGVKKHLRGGTQPYNQKSNNLITVFDCVKKEYRNISVEGITNIKLEGREYNFEELK